MKISKKVLNTEFTGSPQFVKALSEDTACGDGGTSRTREQSLSNFFSTKTMAINGLVWYNGIRP